MLFYQQKCCSQRLVHCNSSSSDPPPLPGVLGLSRNMCKSPHWGSKHGVPHEHAGISAFLGKRLGAEEVPVNPHFAASAISCSSLGTGMCSKSLVSWRALRDCRLLCGGQDTVQLEGRKPYHRGKGWRWIMELNHTALKSSSTGLTVGKMYLNLCSILEPTQNRLFHEL